MEPSLDFVTVPCAKGALTFLIVLGTICRAGWRLARGGARLTPTRRGLLERRGGRCG